MKNELTKTDNAFIKFNVILSTLGALLSVFPSICFFVLCTLMAYGLPNAANPIFYGFMIIPLGFYMLWVYVLWVASDIKNEQTFMSKMPLFIFNILLTVPLLIFYLVIFLRLKFHF